MADSETLPFPLFHGTSTWFLPSILEHGFGRLDIHQALRSREFLREVWDFRLELADAEERDQLLMFPGSMISAMIDDRVTNGGFNFRYGQFYCTAEEWKAVNYALNSCGSELVSEAAKLLHEIGQKSESAADQLLCRYPEVKACINYSHQPIVIRLDGVARSSIKREDGATLTPDLDAFAKFLSFEVSSDVKYSAISIYKPENITVGFAGAESYHLVPLENWRSE